MTYKSEIISLLSVCFGMTGAESGIMFDDAAENGRSYIRFCGDKPVTVAFSKPLSLRFDGAESAGVYIFGLCTAPEHRGKGFAKDVISEICAISDSDFTLLIPETPELFGFYETLGFVRGGVAAKFTATASGSERVSIISDPAAAYRAYKDSAMKCGNLCLLSETDLAASLKLSPQICVAGESGVCFVGADGCEAFAPRECVEGLASSALALCGIAGSAVTVPAPLAPDGAEKFDIGMIKPLRGCRPPELFYINNLFNR